jgi:replicative DNA helicase
LQDSELTILAARPGVGKTALAAGITRHVAQKEGLPVFCASLEQSGPELAERLICAQARVDGQRLRRGVIDRDEGIQIHSAAMAIGGLKVFLDDAPSQSMIRIAANARRMALRDGVRLVVVDYLQLVEPEDRRVPRHEQVGAISRRLKQLAREIEAPVLALAQLNRAVESRSDERPRLSDLRESGGIEADADTVLLMHRPSASPGTVEIQVAKQRNGPTGEITLTFERQFTSFADHAADEPDFEAG